MYVNRFAELCEIRVLIPLRPAVMQVKEIFTHKTHMKLKTHLITLTTCLIALAAPAPLLAAKGDKKKVDPATKAERAARPGMLLKKYDTDKNGAIDGTEIKALREAFDADKTGPLKKLDANKDGTLEDSEVAAIKAHKGKGKGKGAAGKPGKRKKKNA